LHEQRLLDSVVKRLDIGVYDPTLAAVDSQADLLTGLVGVPLWSEPVRARPKLGLEDRLQHHLCGGLDGPISDRGHS